MAIIEIKAWLADIITVVREQDPRTTEQDLLSLLRFIETELTELPE